MCWVPVPRIEVVYFPANAGEESRGGFLWMFGCLVEFREEGVSERERERGGF